MPDASASFFQNRACPYFPCHAANEAETENFNCLFCYCPLYALGKRCGGAFRYTDKGIKDCTNCLFPHRPENYRALLSRYAEIMNVVRHMDQELADSLAKSTEEDTP